jgi:hypothetical protein
MKFLINTITHWDEPPRARHQVAFALSEFHEVIFVAANRTGKPGLKRIVVNENLLVITPFFPFDNRIRYRLPLVNEFYQNWLFRKLKKEFNGYSVINFDFTATRIFSFFSDVIYYCNDSFSSISRHVNPSFIAKYHEKCESEVAARSRFCIGVSFLIKENLLRFNRRTYEIPLGSPDVEALNITVDLTPKKNKPIHVGFMGFIKTLNLSPAIINLLLAEDDFSLTMIGPVEDNFLELVKDGDKKLKLTGPLNGKELYEEMNRFDVTIAPYSQRLVNDRASGVGTGSKLYHYFALGKPVVISLMEGLKDLNLAEGLMYVAAEEKDFPALVRKAFDENNSSLISKRIEFARENRWTKRMEKLIELYGEN